MRNLFLCILICHFLGSCSLTKTNYVPCFGTHKPNASANTVLVFSDKDQVPFEYRELGHIYLKNCWTDCLSTQIDKIKSEAALRGASAVILIKEHKKNSSLLSHISFEKLPKYEYRYYGIAITKME